MLSVLKTVLCTQVKCRQEVGFFNAELVESAVKTRYFIVFYSQPFSCSGLVKFLLKLADLLDISTQVHYSIWNLIWAERRSKLLLLQNRSFLSKRLSNFHLLMQH